MSNTAFGFLVTVVAIIVLMGVVAIFLGPGHNLILSGINLIYQNLGSARANLGL